ncbi:MAG: glycerate kinase type-2 family protein [Candidatus Binatia bacterium]
MKPLQELKKDARSIFEAGVKAADAAAAVRRHVRLRDGILEADGRSYDLSAFDGIYIVGAGKVSARMAVPVEALLGDRLKGGVVNVKYGHALPLQAVKVNEAGHPGPDEAGVRGAKEITALLRRAGEKDLIFCLLSGGGSALLPCPAEGLALRDKQATTEILLQCGATIKEMNVLRKHLSRVKGGRLAKIAHPATVISLILSDVVGDDLDSIASGPTVPDGSTFADCRDILRRYGIREKIPAAVRTFLEKGAGGGIEETPKAGDPIFLRTQNVIVGNNTLAIRAAREQGEQLGFRTLVLSSSIEGDTGEVARAHAAIAKEILRSGNPVERPACVISGGETTVVVRGQGKGGRNQEFALTAALGIDRTEGVVLLSGATDGTDGPTDAAGAMADGTTVSRARARGIEPQHYLATNDSYRFFESLGDLLITGPTYTNVMDLRLILVG